MQETEKHKKAFEAYYASRNISKIAKELHVARKTLHVWKREFAWAARCEERDAEIKEQVQTIMIPQWIATKTLLIQTLLNQVNAAVKSGIAPENTRDLVAASKELRALLGEADIADNKVTIHVKYDG